MNKHIIAECLLGIALLTLLAAIAKSHFDGALDAAKVQAKVEARAEAQKDYDNQLKVVQVERDKDRIAYQNSLNALQHMKPQQIVTKVPEYVSGIPASSRPIAIWGPNVTPPQEGDAIVPADQIKPIAEQILKGNNCILSELPSCVKERDVWIQKYNLKVKDADDWEKLAKGSHFGRKLKRCGMLAGAGFAVGYAPNDPQHRGRNGLIGAGVVGIPCLFIK